MIRINLLPYRAERTKENIRKQVSIFILSFILLVVILLVGQGLLSAHTKKLKNQLDGLQKEVAKYEETAKQVEEFKKQLDLLNKQIQVVDQLKKRREEPPKLLAKLSEMVIAGRMQFTKLDADENKVVVTGTAMDNTTIAEFMTRLQRSGLFTDVALTSSVLQIQYDVEMKQFRVSCTKPKVVNPLEEKQDVGKKGKKRRKKK